MSSSRRNRCSRRDSREFDDFRGHGQQSGHGDRHNYGRHSPISDYRDRDRYLDGLDRTGSNTHPRDGRRNVYSSGHGPRSPLSSRPNGDVEDSKKPRSTSSDSHGYAAKQASKPLPTGPRGALPPLRMDDQRRPSKRREPATCSAPGSSGASPVSGMPVDSRPTQDAGPDRTNTAQTPRTLFIPSSFGQDKSQDVAALLSEFTAHVVTMAGINVHREAAKQNLYKRKEQFNNCKKHHASFPALAEQQLSAKVQAEKAYGAVDKRLQQQTALRDQLSCALASIVIPTTKNSDTEAIQRLQNEVNQTRQLVNDYKSEAGQIRGLQRDFRRLETEYDRLKKEVRDMQSESMNKKGVTGTLQAEAAKIKNQCDELRSLEQKLLAMMEKVENGMNSVNETPGSVTVTDRLHEAIQSCTSKIEESVVDIKALKHLVQGDDDDEGLVRQAERLQKDGEKFHTALTKVDDELDKMYEQDFAKLEGRLAAAESSAVTRSAQLSASQIDESRIDSKLDDLRKEVYDGEHVVATEVDRNKALVLQLQRDITQQRHDLEGASARMEGALQKSSQTTRPHSAMAQQAAQSPAVLGAGDSSPGLWQKGQQTPASRGNNQETSALNQNLAQDIRDFQANLLQTRQLLDQQQQRLVTVEVNCKQLDTQYAQLKPGELAKHAVSEMREIYPQANNTQQSFEASKKSYESLEGRVQEIGTKVQRLEAIPDKLNGSTVKAELDQQMTRVRSTVEAATKELQQLTNQVENMGHSTADELGAVAVRIEVLNRHCGIEPPSVGPAGGAAKDKGKAPKPKDAPHGHKRSRSLFEAGSGGGSAR